METTGADEVVEPADIVGIETVVAGPVLEVVLMLDENAEVEPASEVDAVELDVVTGTLDDVGLVGVVDDKVELPAREELEEPPKEDVATAVDRLEEVGIEVDVEAINEKLELMLDVVVLTVLELELDGTTYW
jgi:hypothetical protein